MDVVAFHLGLRPFSSIISLSDFPFAIARGLHAGITEESMKVAITNFGAWTTRKSSPRVRRIAVGVAGTFAVAFWAIPHYFLNRYPPLAIVLLFFTGMGIFSLICWKKNYLPTVLGHAGWDIYLGLSGTAFL